MLEELKRDFMDAYDENGDGKIEIREVYKLLQFEILLCKMKLAHFNKNRFVKKEKRFVVKCYFIS